MPVGDRYDAVNMTTLDGVLRRFLTKDNGIVMVDSGAGKLGNFWQVGFFCVMLCWFPRPCHGRIYVLRLIL